MKREVYEKQKTFAGEKKPSMKRRFVGHDYTRRGIYMLTMTVEGRRPLFGRILGNSEEARMELSELGSAVSHEWWHIPDYYPQVKIFGLQMMPDHLHGILFVSEPLNCHLSRIVRGFKTGCGRAYRRLVAPMSVATELQRTFKGDHPEHGLLFEPNYNDHILMRDGNVYITELPKRVRNKALFRDDNCSLSQGRDGRWYFCFSLDEDQLAMLPQKLVTQAGAIAQKVIKKLFAL